MEKLSDRGLLTVILAVLFTSSITVQFVNHLLDFLVTL